MYQSSFSASTAAGLRVTRSSARRSRAFTLILFCVVGASVACLDIDQDASADTGLPECGDYGDGEATCDELREHYQLCGNVPDNDPDMSEFDSDCLHIHERIGLFENCACSECFEEEDEGCIDFERCWDVCY